MVFRLIGILGIGHAEVQEFIFTDGELDVNRVDGTDRYQGRLQECIGIVVTRLIAVYRGLLIRQGLFRYGAGCCQLLIAVQVDEGIIERRPGLIDIRFSREDFRFILAVVDFI